MVTPPTPEQIAESRQDTLRHIQAVRANLDEVIAHLRARSNAHDLSKLQEPELSGYAALRIRLADVTYGTPEYTAALDEARATIEHHYQHNDHHPQHHAAGIAGMSLLALLEMLADWKAAAERTKDGSLAASLAVNEQRFTANPVIARLLRTTAEELGWI